MGGGISKMAKQELVATIRDRYRQASKKDKGRILDEFTAITGHHRKHGIRLLGGTADNKGKQAVGRRIYDEAVREAVIVVWEASDRICGKRLKAALPNFVDSKPAGLHGAAWASESRSCREGTSPLSQRSHSGPVAQTHQGHRRQSATAKEKATHGEPDPGAHLQRLELADARLSGNRPGIPLRWDSIGFLYPQPGGHRHLHGMDAGLCTKASNHKPVTTRLVRRHLWMSPGGFQCLGATATVKKSQPRYTTASQIRPPTRLECTKSSLVGVGNKGYNFGNILW